MKRTLSILALLLIVGLSLAPLLACSNAPVLPTSAACARTPPLSQAARQAPQAASSPTWSQRLSTLLDGLLQPPTQPKALDAPASVTTTR